MLSSLGFRRHPDRAGRGRLAANRLLAEQRDALDPRIVVSPVRQLRRAITTSDWRWPIRAPARRSNSSQPPWRSIPRMKIIASISAIRTKPWTAQDAAIEQYRAIVANNAKSVAGHNNLARLLQARGDDRHAAEQLRAAHDEEPSNRDTCIRLALLLAASPDAAVRNGRKALRIGRKAVELTKGKDAAALDTRAAAEAETGDFKAATDDAKAAMKLATAGGDKKLAGEIRPRLDRYREDKPFRAKTVRPGPGIGLRSPGQ